MEVPAAIIITNSAGESQLKVPTQAAEARNRRAEIQFEPEPRFHLGTDLIAPSMPSLGPPPAAPPPVLPPVLPAVPIEPHKETPAEAAKRILAPVPPDPRKPRPPLLGPVIEKIDSMLKGMGLPDSVRGIVKEGAKAAIVRGATASADAVMDQTTMSADQKRAIHALIEAVIKGELP
jgi:hypothetical protein